MKSIGILSNVVSRKKTHSTEHCISKRINEIKKNSPEKGLKLEKE